MPSPHHTHSLQKQQFDRQQPVPCSRCSNRKGSVANSPMYPRHDEAATRWSVQCRSTWNIGNRCQKVWDICIFRLYSTIKMLLLLSLFKMATPCQACAIW